MALGNKFNTPTAQSNGKVIFGAYGAKSKLVGDAKFYKPGSDTSYTINVSNLMGSLSEFSTLARGTEYGVRVVERFVRHATAGRFILDNGEEEPEEMPDFGNAPPGMQIPPAKPGSPAVKPPFPSKDAFPPKEIPTGEKPNFAIAPKDPNNPLAKKKEPKSPEDKKLEQFFEEVWPAFQFAAEERRITGTGFLVASWSNEKATDLEVPIKFRGDRTKKMRWLAPETKDMQLGSMHGQPPQLDLLDWSDDWHWFNYKVDKSRLFPINFTRRYDQWYGWGIVEPCRVSLWALYNLTRGILDRISAWALQRLIFRIDATKARLNDLTDLTAIVDAMNQEGVYILDSPDDLVQLNDKNGMGIEMETLALHGLAACTGIPASLMQGIQVGAVTGSEVDLTQYQLTMSEEQNGWETTLKKILIDVYNLDVDKLQWVLNVMQTTKQLREQNSKLQQGGAKPNPFQAQAKSPMLTPPRPDSPGQAMVPGMTDKTPGDD